MNTTFLKKYKFVVLSFFMGIAVLLIPQGEKVGKLPTTGDQSQLEVTLSVDKQELNVLQENKLNYKINLVNKAECRDVETKVVIAVDSSGSMKSSLNEAKKDALYLAEKIQESGKDVQVVGFNETIYRQKDKSVARSLKALTASKLTNLSVVFETAVYELSSFEGNKQIVVLSDGRVDLPEEKPQVKTTSLANLLKSKDIDITVFKYGRHADSEFLKSLVSKNGTYFDNPSEDQIDLAYSQIIQDKSAVSYDNKVFTDLNLYLKNISSVEVENKGKYEKGVVSWDVSDLSCGEAVSLAFQITVKDNVIDLDRFDLVSTVTNPNKQNFQSNSSVTVFYKPAFQVQIIREEGDLFPGEKVGYLIQIRNTGSLNVDEVELISSFSGKYLTIDRSSLPQKAVLGENQLSWGRFGLDGFKNPKGYGREVNLQFWAFVNEDLEEGFHSLDHKLEIKHSGFSQSFDVSESFSYGCDLKIQALLPNPVIYQEEFDYLIKLENAGNKSCERPIVDITYPAENFQITDSEYRNVSYNVVSYEFGDQIDPFGVKMLTLSFKADTFTPENSLFEFAAKAEAVSEIYEENNTSLDSTTIVSQPVLKIQISTNNKINLENRPVSLSITVENLSEKEAKDLNMKLDISDEMSYIPQSTYLDGDLFVEPDGTKTLSWYLGSMSGKEKKNFQLNLTAERKGLFPVECTLSSANSSTVGDRVNVAVGDDEQFGAVADDDENNVFSINLPFTLSALSKTGSMRNYIKIFFGLGLALPLPLILIYKHSEEKEDGKNKKK